MGERTGSRVLQWVWSYVTASLWFVDYMGKFCLLLGLVYS
ncbi:hypothetical protein CTRU02_207738 [Colletotrichum truncatum]|uniref:Uncharacterized protein n=1 Tax=Colletotrichum truncatum TaxID=5467 RepID=A0ACC3Z1N8_COLTU